MRISAAALEFYFIELSITAAKAIAYAVAKNGLVQRDTLVWTLKQAYDGSTADGLWSVPDTYDMLEPAEVMHVAKADLLAGPEVCPLHSRSWSGAC